MLYLRMAIGPGKKRIHLNDLQPSLFKYLFKKSIPGSSIFERFSGCRTFWITTLGWSNFACIIGVDKDTVAPTPEVVDRSSALDEECASKGGLCVVAFIRGSDPAKDSRSDDPTHVYERTPGDKPGRLPHHHRFNFEANAIRHAEGRL